MRFSVKETLKNVQDVCPSSGFALVAGSIFNLSKHTAVLPEVKSLREISPFGSRHFITRDIRGNSFVVETETLKYEDRFKIEAFRFPYLSVYDYDDSGNNGIYDFEKGIFVTETTNWIGRDFFDSYVLGEYQNTIYCRTLKDHQPVWQFDLSQFGSFSKSGDGETPIALHRFLGVSGNTLIGVLNDSGILLLDLHKGTLTNRFHLTIGKGTDQETTAVHTNLQLQGDTLLYFKNGTYAEYDLKKDKIVYEFSIETLLKAKNLWDNAPGFLKEGNLLYYFVSGFGSHSNPALVLLDLQKQEVIWEYVYDSPGVSFRDFKKNDTQLFALDSENTLHLLELE